MQNEYDEPGAQGEDPEEESGLTPAVEKAYAVGKLAAASVAKGIVQGIARESVHRLAADENVRQILRTLTGA